MVVDGREERRRGAAVGERWDAATCAVDLGVLLAFWGPANPALPSADINRDGVVNGDDLGMFLSAWGTCPTTGACPSDFNDDGVVDGIDLGSLLGAWTS